MGYRVRRAAHGGDRRHGRSLAETLSAGRFIEDENSDSSDYDLAFGPPAVGARRPLEREWGPSEWEQMDDERAHDATMSAIRQAFVPRHDEVLDAWDPEDIAEQQHWKRVNRNINMGLPESWEG